LLDFVETTRNLTCKYPRHIQLIDKLSRLCFILC